MQAMTVSPHSTPPARPTLAVGIPTRGRPAILKSTLGDLQLQTLRPDCVMVVYFEPSDIDDAPEQFPNVHFIRGQGSGGSCAQRNRLLEVAGRDFDLIFIQDDDFFAQRDYLQRAVEAFLRDRSVVGITGKILHNGAAGPGYSVEFARSVLSAISQVPTLEEQPPRPAFNTDGCNMAFRLQVIQDHGIRFDEQMPGYAWYEDIDFSRRLLPYGSLVLLPGAQGIHLGAKIGKTSGRRFGYSQVANPIYLARKGTYAWPNALRSVGRNLAANLAHSVKPEPYVDRHGRLRGNLLGFRDLLRGRSHPGRILDL